MVSVVARQFGYHVTGTFVVRINGEWVSAESQRFFYPNIISCSVSASNRVDGHEVSEVINKMNDLPTRYSGNVVARLPRYSGQPRMGRGHGPGWKALI